MQTENKSVCCAFGALLTHCGWILTVGPVCKTRWPLVVRTLGEWKSDKNLVGDLNVSGT